jgi:hypothetical protein
MIIYALKLRAKTRAIALVALVLGPPLRMWLSKVHTRYRKAIRGYKRYRKQFFSQMTLNDDLESKF